MKLCLLHLDDALISQPAFMQTCEQDRAHQIDAADIGGMVRLWGKEAALGQLSKLLEEKFPHASDEPTLCFMGSGDFHHITALLLAHTIKHHTGPITLIHFDNHPDWVRFDGGMHCGSWVNRALSYPNVHKVITVGVCSHDLRNPDYKGANLSLLADGKLELFPYAHAPSRVRKDYGSGASHTQKNNQIHWRTISEMGEASFLATLLERIQTHYVYVTIDKDVLARQDVETNWDQGIMRLPFLLDMLRQIGTRHTIIGADVTGDYSKPVYHGNPWTKFRKHAEIYMDQPRTQPDMANAATLNSASNHALLDVLSEVIA